MKNFLKYLFIAIMLFTNFISLAQGDDSDGGDLEGNDPAPTPINAKLIYLLILGIIFVFYTFKKKKIV